MSELNHFLNLILEENFRFTWPSKKHIWGHIELRELNVSLNIYPPVNNQIHFALTTLGDDKIYNHQQIFRANINDVLPVLKYLQNKRQEGNALYSFKLKKNYTEEEKKDMNNKNQQILKQFDLILRDKQVDSSFSYQFNREYRGKIGCVKLKDKETNLIHELDLEQLENLVFPTHLLDAVSIQTSIFYQQENLGLRTHTLEIPYYNLNSYPLLSYLYDENLKKEKMRPVKNKNEDEESDEENQSIIKRKNYPEFKEWSQIIEKNLAFYRNEKILDLLFKAKLEYNLGAREMKAKLKL